jgi:hypothetical protein
MAELTIRPEEIPALLVAILGPPVEGRKYSTLGQFP